MRAVLRHVHDAMERLDDSLLGDIIGTAALAALWVAIMFIFYGVTG